MTLVMTALIVVLPIIGMIPAHMKHSAVVTPVDYKHYDYR